MLREQSARRPSGKVVKVVSSCMGIFGLVVWCVGPFFFSAHPIKRDSRGVILARTRKLQSMSGRKGRNG